MMRAKVRQVYREALQEARGCPEGAREAMSDLIRDEFRVFRRDPADESWKLDSDQIDYHLAIVRKQINMVKELRERSS